MILQIDSSSYSLQPHPWRLRVFVLADLALSISDDFEISTYADMCSTTTEHHVMLRDEKLSKLHLVLTLHTPISKASYYVASDTPWQSDFRTRLNDQPILSAIEDQRS